MKQTPTQTGYSLIEVLVSIAVLLIAIVGPMTIATQGIKSSAFSLEQNTAFFLAQEGVEAIESMRDDYALEDLDGDAVETWDWIDDELNSGPCSSDQLSANGDICSIGVDFSSDAVAANLHDCNAGNEDDCQLYTDTNDDRAIFSHEVAGGTGSPYTRIVTIERKTASVVEVTSTVTWDSRVFGNTEQSVSLTTTLFDSHNYD